jgi:hypothetical protein
VGSNWLSVPFHPQVQFLLAPLLYGQEIVRRLVDQTPVNRLVDQGMQPVHPWQSQLLERSSLATLALTAIFNRKGPKQKIATTQMVEKLANAQGTGMMQQNLQGYMDGPHTKSSQAQALANYDAMWAWLVENCGDPAEGDPGKRCISERQRGGIYDMAAGNRDPIANDPNVKPDPILGATGELIDSVTGQLFNTSSGGTGYLILAALLLAGVFFIGGRK